VRRLSAFSIAFSAVMLPVELPVMLPGAMPVPGGARSDRGWRVFGSKRCDHYR